MMKHHIVSVFIFVIAVAGGVATIPQATASAAQCGDASFFVPKWYDNMCPKGSTDGSIMSPSEMGKSGQTSAQDTAGNLSKWLGTIAMNIVKIIMTIVGYVSLGFIIWGGFKYMINGDNSSGTVAARKTIQNAVIGLALSMLSIAIINFVTGAIVG